MLVLGIESSCDETGAAVVAEDGRVRSDVVHSQAAMHAEHGGVVPELASRDHVRNVAPVIREALVRAGVTLADVDAVAVTNRPGLVGALLVGVQTAKGLAWGSGKPLIGVDHLMGHLLAVFLRRTEDTPPVPRFPFVSLLVSGGHTAIYRVDAPRAAAVREIGATRDDAAGEAFDKVAKLLGLGYPGGPIIDRLAREGDASRAPRLTSPMMKRDSFELSFSGIKTQVAQLVAKGAATNDAARADLCAAFQQAVTTVLAEKLVQAARQEQVTDVVLGGGVAANSELRRRVTDLARAHGMQAFLPELASCTDNAAMIAYAGATTFAEAPTLAGGWDMTATSTTSLSRTTRKGRGAR